MHGLESFLISHSCLHHVIIHDYTQFYRACWNGPFCKLVGWCSLYVAQSVKVWESLKKCKVEVSIDPGYYSFSDISFKANKNVTVEFKRQNIHVIDFNLKDQVISIDHGYFYMSCPLTFLIMSSFHCRIFYCMTFLYEIWPIPRVCTLVLSCLEVQILQECVWLHVRTWYWVRAKYRVD